MPVAVRPLSDTPPPAQANAAPPKPDAVPAAAVARLSEPPPSRPAEASTPPQTAAIAGPRTGAQSVPTPQSDDNFSTTGVIYASVTGYRPLSTFDANRYKRTERMAQLSIPRGDLSKTDRTVLGNAALRQTERKGVIRVVGHGDGDIRTGQEKATIVARELERLGVPTNNLFVGADKNPGSTEVILHY